VGIKEEKGKGRGEEGGMKGMEEREGETLHPGRSYQNSAPTASTAWEFSQDFGNLRIELVFRKFSKQSWEF